MTRQNNSTTTTSVSIRDASELDLPAIRDIYNHFVTRSTATFALEEETVEERQTWFKSHLENGLPIIVAEIDDVVIGWASLSFYHQRCAYRQSVELSVYVHHEFAGRGVGKKLTKSLIALAQKLNYHCLLGLVCSENVASLAMMKQFGFEDVGVLKEVGKKFDRWLDVTIVQKIL